MFFTPEQIQESIRALHKVNPFFGTAFLAFKKVDLPVGAVKNVVFASVVEDVLRKYYKPIPNYPGFYSPFKTSSPNERWNKSRYVNSVMRITTDTFRDVVVHPKGQEWGWETDYVEIILENHLQDGLIPAFDMAVWLFRDREWYNGITKSSIVESFFLEFKITIDERRIFQITSTEEVVQVMPSRISVNELLDIIGSPPDSPLEVGAILESLELVHVGPSEKITLNLAPRLNVITGDNGLGKTFLLECIWWSLTGTWSSSPAYPRSGPSAGQPQINFSVKSKVGTKKLQGKYNRSSNSWSNPPRKILPGLSIFARSDGSFAVWDPARHHLMQNENTQQLLLEPQIILSRTEAIYGKYLSSNGRRLMICKGLVDEWIEWQYRSDIDKRNFEMFKSSIELVSPHSQEILEPGDTVRIPPDLQDMPTLRFSYGDVPFIHCSAGIQRIITLVYIIVWSWLEHLKVSEYLGRAPEGSIILLVDEMEAHLHPFWQRTVVPAIMEVVNSLNRQVQIQTIIATHSPLVLASLESIFDERQDQLFHLYINSDGLVKLDEEEFVKQGRVDLWLTSDVFGLKEPRSLEAERAIEYAERLQSMSDAPLEEIQRASNELLRILGPDDQFWARWVYYARKKGVNI